MDEVRYDVVVVGARCAGSATARLLAQQGRRVLLVDRASFPSDTLSTHSVSAHGLELLARWGLLDRMLATGAPTASTMGIRLGDVDLPEVPHHSPRGSLSPRRTVLDHLLVEAAREEGVDVRQGVVVRDVCRDAGRVVGITTDAGDVRADLVVGADGAGSVIARAVGATRYDERPSNVSGVYAYIGGTGLEHNELSLVDQRFGLAFPTNDGLTCVAVGLHTRHFAALLRGGDGAFLDSLDATAPRIASAVRRGMRTTRFHAFRARPGFFHVPAGPGWALVGDAGHYKDPSLGAGIADAFLSAHLLADVVAAGAPMSDYQERRDATLREMYELTHEVASLEWGNDDLLDVFGRFRAALLTVLSTLQPLAVAG